MKPIVLFSTTLFIAGLFTAGLALGADPQNNPSQLDRSSQAPGVATPREQGVGTASGETRKSGSEHQKLAAQNLNQKQINEMQRLLNMEGFNAGPRDGIIGPKTRQALRQFQKSRGIAATGEPDADTLRAMAPSAKEQEFFGLSPKF